jgi:DNA primase
LIPRSKIDEILSATRVEEVVQDFVTLKRKGVNLTGLCPFHDEKTPSFYVSPAKGVYKCFGCGKAGTAVGFVMEHENMTYPEALKYLGNKYNIVVEEVQLNDEERRARQLSDSLHLINEFAVKYYQDILNNHSEGKAIGLSYFKERGFLQKTINQWQLGYALNEGKEFTTTAIRSQYNEDNLKLIGLTTQNGNDFFRERVIFPIHNLGGKVVAFAGRIMTNIKTQPKYINSPESEIYNKRKILFGLYFAKTEIRRRDECIMVEGYTDVMTLHQGGVENVVASSGTSLTEDQIRLVKRFTDNMTIIYDGDAAGIKAALRGLDLVLQQGLNVRLVLLPDGHDPDSFFKANGADQFRSYLELNKKDFITFKTDLLLQESKRDPIKKAAVLRDIVESIGIIPDALKRSFYIQHLSIKMDISEQVLTAEIDKEVDKNKKSQFIQSQREALKQEREKTEATIIIEKSNDEVDLVFKPVELSPDLYLETHLVRILVTGADTIIDPSSDQTVAQYLLPIIEEFLDIFDNELCRKIFRYAIEESRKGVTLTTNDFLFHPDQEISQFAADISITNYTYAHWEDRGVYLQTQPMPDKNYKRDTYQTLIRFKLHKVNKQIKEMEKIVVTPNMEEDELSINIDILKQLMKERNELAKELTQIVF